MEETPKAKLIIGLQICPIPQQMEQAIELAHLIVEIEPTFRDDIEAAVICRFDTPEGDAKHIAEIFEKRFRTIIVYSRRGGTGWPQGPNDLWQDGMMRLNKQREKGYVNADAVLTFEPDCIPMRPDWLTALADAYEAARSRGKWVIGHSGWIGGTVARNHINGNAIFPVDAIKRFPQLQVSDGVTAWDACHGTFLCQIGENTDLIYQIYRMSRITMQELLHVQKGGKRPAMFHGIKSMDGINGIRQMMKDGTFDKVPEFAKPMGSRIYCYHESLGGKGSGDEWLVEEWKRISRLSGWVPVVLGEKDARKHPRFEELDAIFQTFPTINNKQYELACWRRWLAMVEVGGGWMCDYDCIPYMPEPPVPNGLAFGDPHGVPCLVHGSQADYEAAIEEFIKQDQFSIFNGAPHWSDMFACQKLLSEGTGTAMELVEECDRDTGRAFVHFSSRATQGNRKDAIIGVNSVRLK